MVELAKFAKHHIPEEHELDDEDFADKRVDTLGRLGVTSALVSLSKTESHNLRELIARVLNALCKNADLRGKDKLKWGPPKLETIVYSPFLVLNLGKWLFY